MREVSVPKQFRLEISAFFSPNFSLRSNFICQVWSVWTVSVANISLRIDVSPTWPELLGEMLN